MTGAQMLTQFKFFYDKLDTDSNPDLRPEEIYLLLNEAQLRLVKTRYSRNNLYKQGFEEIQKRTEDLNILKITRFCVTVAHPNEPGTYVVNTDLLYDDETQFTPSPYLYFLYLRSRVKVTKGTSSAYVLPTLAQSDTIDEMRYDPFNSPVFPYPLLSFEEGKIYITTDGSYTASNIRLTCLRKPSSISPTQDCELPFPEEVIQQAILIALENIEAPRFASQSNLLNTIE